MSWFLAERRLSRVLVTRLRYLGDIVMATAVIEALRHGDAGLEIGFLCEQTHAAVLTGHPDLARIHELDARRRGSDARARVGSRLGMGAGTLAMVRELRDTRYDAAVDLFFNPRSAWLLWMAGIPARLAGPAGGRRHLFTHGSAPGTAAWPVDLAEVAPGGLGEHLSRLAPLVHGESGLSFASWFRREGLRATTRLAPRAGGRTGEPPPVLLAPGATWATKRWPVSHWRELAATLAAGQERPVRVLPPPGGSALAAAIADVQSAGDVKALPESSLTEVLDHLAGAAGLVAVDGGIMHAAVALGVPTLALFGPTDPGLWFPYEGSGPFRVLATRPACHPCHLHECPAFVCLPELQPATVADAAQALFRGEGER
ncbi:MAG: glycosyltransferase family 9 protein [bacterium]|nr:glycosyltransferase family 9 protein [bacterium]